MSTPSPALRVLSLAGGGFLGLYTAAVLEGLEARAGEPLARRFDLIAGTSIGAVLALALAFEVPMSRLVRLFDLSRSVFGPKYSGAALRKALQADFDGRRATGLSRA